MTFEGQFYGYLQVNWTEEVTTEVDGVTTVTQEPITDIGWIRENVAFNPEAEKEYIVPHARQINAEILEVPASEGLVRGDYIFAVNILLKENSGMSNFESYSAKLKELYHKKDVVLSNYVAYMGPMVIGSGFISGSHFEMPISFEMQVFST